MQIIANCNEMKRQLNDFCSDRIPLLARYKNISLNQTSFYSYSPSLQCCLSSLITSFSHYFPERTRFRVKSHFRNSFCNRISLLRALPENRRRHSPSRSWITPENTSFSRKWCCRSSSDSVFFIEYRKYHIHQFRSTRCYGGIVT